VTTEELLTALKALVESGDQEAIDAALAILEPADESTEEEASAEDAPTDDPEEEDEPAAAKASADAVTADTAVQFAAKLAEADEENTALKAQLEASAKADYFKAEAVSPALQAVLAAKPLAEIKAIVGAMAAKPKVKQGLGTVALGPLAG
jgi:hypothetical protein